MEVGTPGHKSVMSDARELLLQNLPALQQIIRSVCRRRGMNPDETEEFAAVVRLRLVEHDYAVIRAYQVRSSFNTYIAAVVTRMLIDYQRHEWGKWRPSAGAEKLGDIAVELERLLHRDGKTLDEAWSTMSPRHPELTRVQLGELAEQLTPRNRRQFVALDEVSNMAASEEGDAAERSDTAARISQVVANFISGLPRHEQLILKLRFDSEMSVTQIAGALREDYQKLWRGLQKLFRDLRHHLESAGIAAGDVEKIVGSDVLLDFRLKNCGPVPSPEQEESSVAARQEDMSS